MRQLTMVLLMTLTLASCGTDSMNEVTPKPLQLTHPENGVYVVNNCNPHKVTFDDDVYIDQSTPIDGSKPTYGTYKRYYSIEYHSGNKATITYVRGRRYLDDGEYIETTYGQVGQSVVEITFTNNREYTFENIVGDTITNKLKKQ